MFFLIQYPVPIHPLVMNRLLPLMFGTLINRLLGPVLAFLVSQFLSVLTLLKKSAAFVSHPIRELQSKPPLFRIAGRTLVAIGMLLAGWLGATGVQAQTCGSIRFTTDQIASSQNVSSRSGTGGFCTFLTCSYSNAGNVTDANLTNFATIGLNLVGANGGISTRVTSTTMPAGSTAGYVVNNGILNLGVGTSIEITTYLNNVQQDQGLVSGLLDLPILGSGTAFVGIPTTKPYDEIRIQFNLLLGTGSYSVYYPLSVYDGKYTVQNPTLAAPNSGSVSVALDPPAPITAQVPLTYTWSTGASTSAITGLTTGTYSATISRAGVGCLYTKTIDLAAVPCGITPLTTNNITGVTVNTATVGGQVRTGINGICVGCSVTGTGNIIDANTTNSGTINILAGLATSGRVSVLSTRRVFPAGIRTGFVIQDNGLLGTALFNGTTVKTYLDGNLQETANVTGLFDLPLLTTGYQSLGFITTKPFDEVQLDATNLAGLLINVGVSYAFVSAAGPVISQATVTNTAFGGSTGTISTTVTSGTPPYTYAWSNGATTSAITGLAAGVYSLTASDVTGCTDIRSFTVGSNAAVTPTIAINSPAANAVVSSTPTISGTATAGSTVTITAGAGATGGPISVTTTAAGTWSTNGITFAAGANSITAVAGLGGLTSTPVTRSFSVAAALTVNATPATQAVTPGVVASGNAGTILSVSGGVQPLSYSVFAPASGSATGSIGPIATAHGTVSINATTGAYSYTATPGYSGTDAIGIKVCDASPTPQCVSAIIPINVSAPASATASLDCSSANIMGIVAGTAGSGVLKLTMSVSTTGSFPVTVLGSGLSANPSPYVYTATGTGVQSFYVPLAYSGAAFAAGTTFTVAGAGVCTVDMTAVTPKTVSTSVLNLGPACAPATAATLIK